MSGFGWDGHRIWVPVILLKASAGYPHSWFLSQPQAFPQFPFRSQWQWFPCSQPMAPDQEMSGTGGKPDRRSVPAELLCQLACSAYAVYRALCSAPMGLICYIIVMMGKLSWGGLEWDLILYLDSFKASVPPRPLHWSWGMSVVALRLPGCSKDSPLWLSFAPMRVFITLPYCSPPLQCSWAVLGSRGTPIPPFHPLGGQKQWEEVAFSSLEAEGSFLNLNDQLQSYFCGLKFMTCCALLFQTRRCRISQSCTKVAWPVLVFPVLKFDFTCKEIWNDNMYYAQNIYIIYINYSMGEQWGCEQRCRCGETSQTTRRDSDERMQLGAHLNCPCFVSPHQIFFWTFASSHLGLDSNASPLSSRGA